MNPIFFILLIVGSAALLSWPLGAYMKWAMDPDQPERGVAGWKNRAFRLLGGRFLDARQNWKQYAISMLVFNAVMFLACFGLLALQHYLPLNPDGKGALEGSLIFNTAASFTTNTNLQHYSGEEHVNVGCGQDISIRELAELVREVVGYDGDLVFDTSMPDGMPRKLLDVTRLQTLNWQPRIGLREGVASAYRWFVDNAAPVRR